MWTDPESGFGLSDALLSAYGPEELPALADDIESTMAEDPRVKSASLTFTDADGIVLIDGVIVANTSPPTGFRLVGPLSALKAEILTDTQRLLNG
jgi:hypothetical protein